MTSQSRHSPKTRDADRPYNPWSSYIVEASAGSGKTWQLSRRFLALVMAGADPASILTATFTNKAAAEMRERIIRDAVQLGLADSASSSEFREFADEIDAWAPRGEPVRLRSPQETSNVIIANTQSLKITTIDALFMQWSQRCPLETSVTMDDETLRSPWELLSGKPLRDLDEQAWLDVLSMASDHHENRVLMESISRNAPSGKIKALTAAITPLTQSETFIWYAQLVGGHEPLRLFTLDDPIPEDQEFLRLNTQRFQAVLTKISDPSKRSEAMRCLDQCDMSGLVDLKIVNKALSQLHGNTFRAAIKNADADLAAVNVALAAWSDQRKLQALNHSAELIWALYKAKATAAHRRKIAGGYGSFSDAIKGVSRLAVDESLAGGRAVAWSSIRHLMLDEFQDTSRLQWLIFEKLARERLAGEGETYGDRGPRPSVFIVGDKKQSIYRFREAAPEVLDLAKEALEPLGLLTKTMSDSFRSSVAILDYVNAVFADGTLMVDFPKHQASVHVTKKHPERYHYGSVCVYEAAETITVSSGLPNPESGNPPTLDRELSAREREASTVAFHIKRCLTGDIATQVYDPKRETWRPARAGDFAILYPKSQTATLMEDALRRWDIPSVRAETKGYFARQEIQDVNALVTWLTWPADTVALCTILRSPIIGLDDRTLQHVISDGPDCLWGRLQEFAPDAYTMLAKFQKRHLGDTLPEIAATLIHEYGIDERYRQAFGPIEGPLAQANIRKWLELTRSASVDDALSVYQWSQTLDEAESEDETGNASTARDAVTMMTIHKSKGLEFPIVIVTGTAADWHTDESGWIKDSRPGHEGLWYIGTNQASRPENCPEFETLRRMSEDASRAEKSRLLYVALTRASQHLVITGAIDRSTKNGDHAFHAHLKATARTLGNTQTRLLKAPSQETVNAIMMERPLAETAAASIQQRILYAPSVSTTEVVQTSPKSLGTLPVKILTASKQLKAHQPQDQTSAPKVTAKIPEGLASAYGTMVHKLLETCVLGSRIRDDALLQLLRREALRPTHDDLLRPLIALARQEVQSLVGSPLWRDLMCSVRCLHTELPMISLETDDAGNQQLIQAKADLVIEYMNNRVVIVDFKTTLVTPQSASDVCRDKGYTEQVQAYIKQYTKATRRDQVSGAIVFTSSQIIVDLALATVS